MVSTILVPIKSKDKIIYIDPAYLRTYYAKYPKKIEFSKWPDPIYHAGDTDFIPEMKELGNVDVALQKGEAFNLK